MGWSTGKMTLVYQHITAGVRQDVASRVGIYLCGEEEAPCGCFGDRRTDPRGQGRTAEIEQSREALLDTRGDKSGDNFLKRLGNAPPESHSSGAFPLVTAEVARFELAIGLTPKPA